LEELVSLETLARRIWHSLRGTPPAALSTVFEQE